MLYRKIKLSTITSLTVGEKAELEIYLNDENPEMNFGKRQAMLVIPGGGYQICSRREAEPIALRFMCEGFNCFVLTYSCNKPYPLPHREVAIAMNYINSNADEFNIQKGCVSLVGFSAGGHLAASYGYAYKDFIQEIGCEENILKPFSLVLGYPVISSKFKTHSGSIHIITNDERSLMDYMCVEENITSDYPPTFVWTTEEDTCVPNENSKILIKTLNIFNVKNQLIIYKKGIHGGSLCNRLVYPASFNFEDIEENKNWPTKAANFVYSLIK